MVSFSHMTSVSTCIQNGAPVSRSLGPRLCPRPNPDLSTHPSQLRTPGGRKICLTYPLIPSSCSCAIAPLGETAPTPLPDLCIPMWSSPAPHPGSPHTLSDHTAHPLGHAVPFIFPSSTHSLCTQHLLTIAHVSLPPPGSVLDGTMPRLAPGSLSCFPGLWELPSAVAHHLSPTKRAEAQGQEGGGTYNGPGAR